MLQKCLTLSADYICRKLSVDYPLQAGLSCLRCNRIYADPQVHSKSVFIPAGNGAGASHPLASGSASHHAQAYPTRSRKLHESNLGMRTLGTQGKASYNFASTPCHQDSTLIYVVFRRNSRGLCYPTLELGKNDFETRDQIAF